MENKLLNRLIHKLIDMIFAEYSYGIAYKKIEEKSFHIVLPTLRYSFADPFIIEYNNRVAIFVELMDYRYGLGTIGVFEIKDGIISNVKEIIKEKYHMSFPNIFFYGKDLYMIPETYNNNDIHLYKCISFPDKWQIDSVLLHNENLVDHAVFQQFDNTYVVSFDIKDNKSRCFILDWDDMKLNEIFPKGNYCLERPGGTFYYNNDHIERPIQECKNCYGEYLKIYELKKMNNFYFEESFIRNIKIENIQFDINKQFERVHQYSKSDNYEVIDYYFKKYYWNKPIRLLFQRIIHSKRKFS